MVGLCRGVDLGLNFSDGVCVGLCSWLGFMVIVGLGIPRRLCVFLALDGLGFGLLAICMFVFRVVFRVIKTSWTIGH